MEKLHYFIQANIYLTISWIFYAFILKKETFHQWNRAFLVGSGIGSLLLPLFSEKIARIWLSPPVIPQEELPTWVLPAVEISAQIKTSNVAGYEYMYWVGFGVSCLFLLVRSLKTYQLFRRREVGAWSFLSYVFVHPQLPNFRTILLHERIHARQFHTLDVLFWEVTTLFFWMNPVVYALRHAIRQVHEFIADDRAARSMKDRTEYATLLVQHQLGASLLPSLEHQFYSHTTLKSRITMIMKKPSHRVALLKYGFIVPLFGLAITLSSARLAETTQPEVLQSQWEMLKNNEIPLVENLLELPIPSKTSLSPAANDTTQQSDRKVYSSSDVLPEFPGGIDGMYKWIGRNIQYPVEARRDKIQGKVYVRFIIETDGTISNAQIVKGIHPYTDAEALRVISSMPAWKPGRMDDKPVAVSYNMPISFTLDEPNPQPKTEKLHIDAPAIPEQNLSEVVVSALANNSKSAEKKPPLPPSPPRPARFDADGTTIFVPSEKNLTGQRVQGIPTSGDGLKEIRVSGDASSKAIRIKGLPEDTEYYVDNQRVEQWTWDKITPSQIKSVRIDKKNGANKVYIELKKED